ncbi:MAG: carbohydrate porin, partial [Ignavibacteria bacterium]|nr:carbohydrate porin [Ignavibacteria bacterium]
MSGAIPMLMIRLDVLIKIGLVFFCIFCIFISTPFAYSQQSDTTLQYAKRSELDSLRTVIDSLYIKIDMIRYQIGETNPFDSLLTTLEEEKDTSFIPEDQRSRRKQLDALLEYISQRPGQLFFNGQANVILQGNLQRQERYSTGVGSINLFASSSFGNNTILFVDLEAVGGNGPDEFSETIGSLNGDAGSTQSEDGSDRIAVNEAWAEFLFLDNIFTITAGKIDLTNYFDNNAAANDENSQFISGIFINNPAYVVPSNSPGIRFRTTILEKFYIQLAFAKAENTGSKIFNDIYKSAGFGFKLFPFTSFEADLHVFGYTYPLVKDQYGFGVSMNQTIAQSFKIFGRVGNNENTLADWYGIKTSWSAGAQFEENLFGEPTIIGIAYGSIKPADSSVKNEKSTELYFQQLLNNWVSISTHLQHIWDTGGVNGRYK